VPRPRRLDEGLLPGQLTFNPEEMHVKFVVDKVAIRQVSVQVLCIPPDGTLRPIFILLLLLLEQAGETSGPSDEAIIFSISGSNEQERTLRVFRLPPRSI